MVCWKLAAPVGARIPVEMSEPSLQVIAAWLLLVATRLLPKLHPDFYMITSCLLTPMEMKCAVLTGGVSSALGRAETSTAVHHRAGHVRGAGWVVQQRSGAGSPSVRHQAR